MVDKITDNKLEIISLYSSNYLEKYHLRRIAKLIKKNHVTLLPHIKELENDKILLSEKEGRNKNFLLNLDNILTKKYLLLSQTRKTIQYLEKSFLIKKITGEIMQLNIEGSVVLFGSYAKSTYLEHSDIDILYIGKINDEQVKKIKRIGKIYGKKINVKTTSLKNFETGLRKKDILITEIISNNILLENLNMYITALWRYYNEIKRK